MIIDLKTNFVYKCPACFSFHTKQLGVFDVPENSTLQIPCKCGSSYASISRSNNQYVITTPCFVCGDEHKYKISKKRFWKSDFLVNGCGLSSLDVCAVGNKAIIKKWIVEYSSMLDAIMESDFEE